jgi:hypothetical protein
MDAAPKPQADTGELSVPAEVALPAGPPSPTGGLGR